MNMGKEVNKNKITILFKYLKHLIKLTEKIISLKLSKISLLLHKPIEVHLRINSYQVGCKVR